LIPQTGRALADLAQKLALSVTPDIQTGYSAANAGMISLLMFALAQETESAISRRLEDGDALRELFDSSGAKTIQAALDAFSASQPMNMTATEVTAWLNKGLSLLVELHAWAEDNDTELDQRIWAFLYQHTERHKIDL
jgi:hypothetical protein